MSPASLGLNRAMDGAVDRLMFPRFGAAGYVSLGVITLYRGGSSSNYHALQITARKRFSQGFLFEGSYMWSKAIDEALSQLRDSYNLRASRGIAAVHIPHRFVMSFLYELPVGNASRAVDAIFGGWQISGIASYQTGNPLIISANNTAGLCNLRTLPNNKGTSGARSGRAQDRLNAWFEPRVFSQPAPDIFGNHSLYSPDIRSDAVRNWDLSLFKQFRIAERLTTQSAPEPSTLSTRRRSAARIRR